jgi:hypothetical protein
MSARTNLLILRPLASASIEFGGEDTIQALNKDTCSDKLWFLESEPVKITRELGPGLPARQAVTMSFSTLSPSTTTANLFFN